MDTKRGTNNVERALLVILNLAADGAAERLDTNGAETDLEMATNVLLHQVRNLETLVKVGSFNPAQGILRDAVLNNTISDEVYDVHIS